MAEKKFLKQFFIRTLLLLVAVIAAVVAFDPFFHYHKPLPGLKAVLTDKEYQCIGTLRTFDYDALIVGSSVCENYNNHWFDEGFSCTAIKAIRSYGATADLKYLLDSACEDRNLRYVFYNIDPSSLSASTEPTYVSTGCPMYLYDKNPWNDYQYTLNKDVLMEKLPYMLAFSFMGDYDEGNSYNWAQWKYFGADLAMGMYARKPAIAAMQAENTNEELLTQNIALLTSMANSHPDTTFKFFFSPYSMLWWDNAYRTGERDAVLYNEKKAIEALLACENAEIYFYQDDREVITNLDNYMDMIHFSKDINYRVYEKLAAGEGRLTEENYEEKINEMYQLSEEIASDLIYNYYQRDVKESVKKENEEEPPRHDKAEEIIEDAANTVKKDSNLQLQEEEMVQKLQAAVQQEIYTWAYIDMDHDGTKELIGAYQDEKNAWRAGYCSSNGQICEAISKDIISCGNDTCSLEIMDIGEETHIVYNCWNLMGTEKRYSILALQNQKIVCLVPLQYGYVRMSNEGDILLSVESYNAMYEPADDGEGIWLGHTWNDTYLFYEDGVYKEYGASEIAEEEFMTYENAQGLKEQIEKELKQPDTTKMEYFYFKRNNGILHIQCNVENEFGTITYGYYTVRYQDNTLEEKPGEYNPGQMSPSLLWGDNLETVY